MPKEKRKIKVKGIVGDIRGGMSGIDLMDKYSMTQEQLKSVLEKLCHRGHILRKEMFELTPLSESAVMEALESTGRVVSELQGPVALRGNNLTSSSSYVECSRVNGGNPTDLRTLFERLLQETRSRIPQALRTDRSS